MFQLIWNICVEEDLKLEEIKEKNTGEKRR